ncbi:hypothetical protein T492DRAFT_1009021 [Pavlovales sp. CCMP2436]|nr:hypothetical protein T492DRAFT_1009021 [Pavlovales sp. CCMP2436]
MMVFVSVRINTTMGTAFHFYREVEASASATKPLAGTVKAATAEDERIVEAATSERGLIQALLASTVKADTAEGERIVEARIATAERERIHKVLASLVEADTAERERVVEAVTAERERLQKVLAFTVEAATAERERTVEAATAERECTQKLEAEAAQLKSAEAARGSLIRMVMHHLRSPLLSVANAVVIVQDLKPETRVDNECMRAMATCSQLMQHIVSDMLDFERTDRRLVLAPAAMRISQLLQAAVDSFGGLAAAKEITLCLVPLHPDLDQAVFIGDVRWLQQCLNHGVNNSIKFTEAGGTIKMRAWRGDEVQAQAESKTGQPGPAATSEGTATAEAVAAAAAIPRASVVLEVEDSGVGLTADEVDVLNHGKVFTQLQGSGGSDLGLIIARNLLRLHGGSRMHIASAGPGYGSTFRLELTLPEAPTGTPVVESMPGGGAANGAQGADKTKRQSRPRRLSFPPGFRVLHMEDDAILRRSLELRVLKKFGVPFDVAVNGAEAVRLILEEKCKYALVLMDNQMPILTGEKATRALRAGGFEGLIVGMTGDPKGCSERDEFEAAGLTFFVDKDLLGIQRVTQELVSFTYDEVLEEEPGVNKSSSSLSAFPSRRASAS